MNGECIGHRRSAGRFRRIGLALLLAVMTSVGPLGPTPPVAQAASFTVTSTLDEVDANPGNGVCAVAGGGCTLRAAIMEANGLGGGPHSITVPAGTYTLTIAGNESAGTAGDLDVISGVTVSIVGAGADRTIIQAGPTPGNGIDRVFAVNQDAALSVSAVTVRHGKIVGEGAGIVTRFGSTLELNRVVVTANHAVREGNLCGHGGGIKTRGPVSVIDSTISGNTADCEGGGIYNDWSTTLTNVTIGGNVGGFGAGGIQSHDGFVNLRSVTVVGNTSRGSTVSSVGGVAVAADGTTVRNSIIAHNSGASGRENCGPSTGMTSEGHNLSNTGECPFTATGDLRNTDPKLGPLQNNGGPSPTHALLPDSPAVDAGNPATPGRRRPERLPICRPARGLASAGRRQQSLRHRRHRAAALPGDQSRRRGRCQDRRSPLRGGRRRLHTASGDPGVERARRRADRPAVGDLQPGDPGTGEDAAATGDLDITQSLALVTKGSTVDGGSLDRIFDVRNGAQVAMSLLTIQGEQPRPGSLAAGCASAGPAAA